MPNKDGTGPNGQGPKTGRQMGNCNGAIPQGNFRRGRRPCCNRRRFQDKE